MCVCVCVGGGGGGKHYLPPTLYLSMARDSWMFLYDLNLPHLRHIKKNSDFLFCFTNFL
jgi:hypothetical protein